MAVELRSWDRDWPKPAISRYYPFYHFPELAKMLIVR